MKRIVALAALVLLFGGTPAAAQAQEVQSGWWSSAAPVLRVGAPPDGLLVQGGAAAGTPLAYAAVSATLAPGERATSLRLAVPAGSSSTPGSMLAACPLTEDFVPAKGGPAAEGPAFDCEARVTATPSADGATYTFDLAGLELEADGRLAVALLPTRPNDRVVLSAPTPDAVGVEGGDDLGSTSPGFGEEPAADAFAPTDSSGSFGSSDSFGSFTPAPSSTGSFTSSFDVPVTGAPASALEIPDLSTGAPSAGAQTAAPSAAAVTAQPISSTGGDDRSLVPFLFLAAAVGAAVLWRFAGQSPEGELA